MGTSVKSYAKLNLTLAVTGKAGNMHTLDSLVCSVDIFDVVKVAKRKDGLVSVEMHGMGSESIPFEKNNAVKAAESYIAAFGTRGADIKIYKNIPMGAGLGGSSADAAGVLRAMAKLYGAGSERELKRLADGLGSDTGYMLTGGYARLSGRGDKVYPLDCKTRLDFLLLLPNSGVSTAECYSRWDAVNCSQGASDGAVSSLLKGDKRGLGEGLFNDLYPAAKTLNGDVESAYNYLKSFSPLGVNMTGSGSCVYALFENPEFCDWAKSRYRGNCLCTRVKTVIPER